MGDIPRQTIMFAGITNITVAKISIPSKTRFTLFCQG